MNKMILAVLALAVACGVAAAGELEVVTFPTVTLTNGQATAVSTNATALRGYVRAVHVVFANGASSYGTGTVTIATAPTRALPVQTLYPATATAASASVYPAVQSKVALSAVNDWVPFALFDEKIVFTVGTIITTGTVSVTPFVVYERAF